MGVGREDWCGMQSPELELCDRCGFDSRRWNRQDTVNTIPALAVLARESIAGASPSVLRQRPDGSTWSIGEYVAHAADIICKLRMGIEIARDHPGTDLGLLPDPPFWPVPVEVDVPGAIEALDDASVELADVVGALTEEQWSHSITFNDETLSIDWAARHAIHDVEHHMDDIASIRRQLGDGITTMTGRVDQINASDGGVPKMALASAEVELEGLVGDRQADRRHHGKPWQTICLFSAEAIEAFRTEGHPISAGSVGENLTISGIDWVSLRPGLVIQIGDLRMRLTVPAVPCGKNNQWFSDNTSSHIDYEVDPARARWYASVLTPGRVHTGDSVIVEP